MVLSFVGGSKTRWRHLSPYYVPTETENTMVPVRSTSLLRTSPNRHGGHHHPTHRLIFCSAFIAALGLTAIYLFSPRQHEQQEQQHQLGVASLRGASGLGQPKQSFLDITMKYDERGGGGGGGRDSITSSSNEFTVLKDKDELDLEELDPLKITQGYVTYNGNRNLSYYHCGPLPSSSSPQSISSLTELVLLHGSAFTKEHWKSSGILDRFCEINNTEDEGNLSILALDLPVSADATELGYAFDALVKDKILTGRPATFVTPSASGYAIVSLGEEMTKSSSSSSSSSSMKEEKENMMISSQSKNNLTTMVKAWIPVASFAVLSASDDTLLQFTNTPILAIHGDKDLKGKKVTERLKDTNKDNVNGLELEGRHPVYLDSPEEFVREVMQFLDEKGL